MRDIDSPESLCRGVGGGGKLGRLASDGTGLGEILGVTGRELALVKLIELLEDTELGDEALVGVRSEGVSDDTTLPDGEIRSDGAGVGPGVDSVSEDGVADVGGSSDGC